MPYKSLAQERFFHSPGATKAGITSSQVSEFDQASKGMKLPQKVNKPQFGNIKKKLKKEI